MAGRQHWVITAQQAHQAGLTVAEIMTRVRRREWRKLFRGVYLVDPDLYSGGCLPFHTMVSAGLLAAGPRAVAVLATSATLLGLPSVGDEAAVHVAVPGPAARHNQNGLVVHQMRIPVRQQLAIDGLRCTTALRTVADAACCLPRWEAVSLIDAALNKRLIDPADLVTAAALMARRPGCVAGRRYLAEADGRAQSPGETRVRLICADAGMTPDALQHPVRDRHGVILGYADLAWLAARVAVEVDGADPHSHPVAVFRDRFRQNDFTLAGWRIVRFTWADTFRPGYVTSVLRSALSSRS